MTRLILAVTLLLFVHADAGAQDWQPIRGRNGYYRTEVSATGTTPGGNPPTTLAIQCYPGKRGYVVFAYGVRQASQVTGFHFSDFEGPDAPAADRKLVTVRVKTRRGDVVMITSVSGGSTDESDPETFVFQFGITGNLRGDTKRLIDALKGGASQIAVAVQDSQDEHKFLRTNFPTAGAAKAVTAIMNNCGK